MRLLIYLYKKISHTKALEQTSEKNEMMFFEHVYRITYLAGQSTSDKGLGYKLYGWCVKLLICMLVCSECWFMFCDILSLDEMIDSINITLLQFLAIYKYKNMNDNKHTFKRLAGATRRQYCDTTTFKRRKLLVLWTTRNKFYLKLVVGLGSMTLAVWNLFPMVDDEKYNLAVAVHIPFDYRHKYRYPFVYILVQVAFSYAAGFIMVVDITILAHLMHLLYQYTVLADCFEDIITDCKVAHCELSEVEVDRRFQTKYTERLGDLIVQHIFLLNNTMDLRNILSTSMLGQLATSTILISSVAFQAAVSVSNVSKFLMSCLFLGYNMCELFIICRWCDDIKLQSTNISVAAYFSGWEGGVSKIPGVRSRLLLVITRAAKPLVLTAGGMYDLSLISFTALVKVSYSALTVLLRVR